MKYNRKEIEMLDDMTYVYTYLQKFADESRPLFHIEPYVSIKQILASAKEKLKAKGIDCTKFKKDTEALDLESTEENYENLFKILIKYFSFHSFSVRVMEIMSGTEMLPRLDKKHIERIDRYVINCKVSYVNISDQNMTVEFSIEDAELSYPLDNEEITNYLHIMMVDFNCLKLDECARRTLKIDNINILRGDTEFVYF